MINQIIVIGKVRELPVLKETTNGNKVASILLDVMRNFRNSEGEYEQDIMQFTLWKGVAESTVAVSQIGDLVAIKGRIQSSSYESKEGLLFYNYEMIAEKVTFLNQNQEVK